MATEDGKWIVAATPDGTLHSIEIASGLHRIVSKPVQPDERMHLPDDLKPIRGSSKFLVESFDDDNPLRLWDPSAQSITEINSVPPSFWHCVWGKFGHHFVNEQHELWDLEDRKPIRLPLPRSAEISELVCDATSATAWVATKDGLVYVIDLNTTAVRAKLAASPTPVGLVRLSLSSDRRWFFFSGDLSEYDRKNRAQSKFKTRLAVFEVEELLR
jgi:hypothetical protein